ncbi:MAG TPA: class I SAM-dependent methyltransferase [Ktedonobacterales bacterium]
MNHRFTLGTLIQAASAWSLPLPLLIGAGGVVVLLAVVLLVWRWRRRARPTRPAVPAEAPELADLRSAETTEDMRFCAELARSVGGPVLELGAGTGRIALELTQRGLAVTALEPSQRMVQWAKAKAEQRSTKRPVEWIEGELTSFALDGRRFKLILAPDNVLQRVGDLDALERCLRCVAEHLEPDGTFVAIVEPPRWETLSFARRYLKTVYNARTGELVNIYHSLDVDPLWQQVREMYTHEIWDQKGHRREVVVPFEGSYLTCPQMTLLLRAARMELKAVYGSFAREPLTVKSRQLIFVARPLPETIQPVPTQAPALVGAAAAGGISKATRPARPQRGAASAGVPTPADASESSAAPGSSTSPTFTRPLRPSSSPKGESRASGAGGAPPAPGAQARSQVPPGR